MVFTGDNGGGHRNYTVSVWCRMITVCCYTIEVAFLMTKLAKYDEKKTCKLNLNPLDIKKLPTQSKFWTRFYFLYRVQTKLKFSNLHQIFSHRSKREILVLLSLPTQFSWTLKISGIRPNIGYRKKRRIYIRYPTHPYQKHFWKWLVGACIILILLLWIHLWP